MSAARQAFSAAPARVRVPATSANLGPGFDALGLALGLHDELAARVTESGLHIEVRGEGSTSVALDESHLVIRAMRRAFADLDAEPSGIALTCVNKIPHGRGLGSSAAAIVGGVLLARGLVSDGRDVMSDSDVLRLASDMEGHPDNVASCLLGGLTVSWMRDGAARAVRRDLDPAITPVLLIPPFEASTAQARQALPQAVPHQDAAFTAGRAALLVAALTGTPQALLDATEDRLHQGYRAPALPETAKLVERLRGDGLPAVVSGAGPTVLVLARGDVEARAAASSGPSGWTVATPGVDATGAADHGRDA